MRKTFSVIILCIATALCSVSPDTVSATVEDTSHIGRQVSRFNDDFSGKTISSWRWKTNNVSIPLVNGVAQFRSNTNIFPYIATQTNPFPATQKFSVEFGFRYTNIAGPGTGLIAHAFSPAPGDPPYVGTNWQFQVWQDTIRPLQISFNGALIYQASGADLNAHMVAWVRTDQDRFYLDGNLIHTATIQSPNPKAIWIGNFSNNINASPWTGFDLDFVRVLRIA